MTPVARTWTSDDGLTLHADDYAPAGGAARLPVVCIHGLTRNRLDFAALAPRIAAGGRRVLALDVRGRGLSDWDPAADYRLPAYVRDVAALFRQAGIGRALFVGTSMGGLITMALAIGHTALVAGAVINDIGPELDPAGLGRIAGYVGRPACFASWAEAEAYVRDQNAHALPHFTPADWAAMARRLFRETGDGISPAYDPAIARPFADGPTGDDPWQGWTALTAAGPVLLLRGSLSDLLSASVAERMVAAAPSARLVTVPGVGHAPMLDEPVSVAAIDAFLADQP